MKSTTEKYFCDLYDQYPALIPCKDDIFSAFSILIDCYKKGGKLLICGNGGSAADSEHMVGELMKEFRIKRSVPETMLNKLKSIQGKNSDFIFRKLQQALPAISLVSQISLITACANDVDESMVFAQQVYGYAKPNDVLFAMSTSGNSPNVCNAAHVARAMDIQVIGLTGENNSNLSKFGTVIIAAPSSITYCIQEFHMPIYHTICLALEEEFFGI